MTDQGFKEFVETRYVDLLRIAYLLTGSAYVAEDLVQTALVKTMRGWARVEDPVVAKLRAEEVRRRRVRCQRRHREPHSCLLLHRSDGVVVVPAGVLWQVNPSRFGLLWLSGGLPAGGSRQPVVMSASPLTRGRRRCAGRG